MIGIAAATSLGGGATVLSLAYYASPSAEGRPAHGSLQRFSLIPPHGHRGINENRPAPFTVFW